MIRDWIHSTPQVSQNAVEWVENRVYEPLQPLLSTGLKFKSGFITYFVIADKDWTVLKDYGVFTRNPPKHYTVFSPKTVNIEKMANSTAHTKKFRENNIQHLTLVGH